jgi:hypothetical protein
MRKVLFPLLLLAALACTDSSVLEPPVQQEMSLEVAASSVLRTEYSFQASRDWSCGIEEGCLPGTERYTPSGVAFFEDFKALFEVEGDLVGDLWVMGRVKINLNNGKGVATAAVQFDLVEPGVGTFRCQAHADYEGYNPPLFAYVEHGRYSSCEGTGDFEGKKMKAWLDNEANPGLAIVDGVAEIR